MTTVAVSMVSREVEKITSQSGLEEISCKTASGALVALRNNNIQAGLVKQCSSADSGDSLSEAENSDNTMDHQSQDSNSNSTPSEQSSPAKSSQQSSQEPSDNSKCSQESKKSSRSTKSSCSSVVTKSDSTPSKQSDEESQTSSSSTLKGSVNNDDENSCSSVSSSSTVRSGQSRSQKTDNDSISKSSSRSQSQRSQSSPSKPVDSESTPKTSRSISQCTNDESDDEKNSKSSCTQSSRRTSPDRSDHESERSQMPHTGSSGNHKSQSSALDSSPRSTSTSSQRLESEGNGLTGSRPSSRTSSRNSTPSKQDRNKDLTSKKYSSIIDSDSDEEIYSTKFKPSTLSSHSDAEQSENAESSNVQKDVKSKTIKRKVIDSDSDEGSVKQNNSPSHPTSKSSSDDSDEEESKPIQKSNKFSNLIDSDSESGSDNQIKKNRASSGEENDSKKIQKEKKKAERKRVGTARASKDLAMQQIRSETQRLVRESNISLPYHRPKQRTLQEFLNRKKIIADIPKNMTVAERVKLFPEIISKVVEEKEKEAELFYKSSDSEDEQSEEPMEVDQSKNEINGSEFRDKIESETDEVHLVQTEDSQQVCNQESLDKKSLNHSPASAVSRKLFMDDSDAPESQGGQGCNDHPNDGDRLVESEVSALVTSEESESTEIQVKNSNEPGQSLMSESENTAMDVENSNCNIPESSEEIQEENRDGVRSEVNKQLDEHKDHTDINTEEFELKLSETETDSHRDQKSTNPIKSNEESTSSIKCDDQKELTDMNTEDFELELSETETDCHKIHKSTNPSENNDENHSVNDDHTPNSKENSENKIQLRLDKSPRKSSIDANDTTSIIEQKMLLENSENQIEETSIHQKEEPVSGVSLSIANLGEGSKDAAKLSEEIEDEGDEDPILKLNGQIDGEKILDYNALRPDFGLAPEFDDDDDVGDQINIKDKILADVSNIKPMIRGMPGSIIDFHSTGEIKEGASRLIDRFVRHSLARKSKATKVTEVKILRTEGSGDDVKIVEEVLPFSRDAVEEDDPKKDRKPGERLVKLREELKSKIAQVRSEEWKQREQNQSDEEEEIVKCKDDDFYAGLPDEEEEFEDEESAESEPEEDDVPIVENRKPKSKFVDEEAEESMDEDVEDTDIDQKHQDELSEMEVDDKEEAEENEEDEEEEEEEDDDEDEDEEDDDDDEESEKEQVDTKPKVLRRIIRPADDDSDDSDTELKNDGTPEIQKKQKQELLERSKNEEDMFASQRPQADCPGEDMDNDGIQSFERNRCDSESRNQNCKTPLPRSNLFSILSPLTVLPSLNTSIDSATKSASKNGPVLPDSVEKNPNHDSTKLPISCTWNKMMNLTKKLFDDPPETVNDDEILEICSGKFTNTQNSQKPPSDTSQSEVTDSQIMGLCSGAFGSQPVDMKALESNDSLSRMADENSQDITLTLDDDDANSKLSPVKTWPKAKENTETSARKAENDRHDANIFEHSMKGWYDESPAKSQNPNQITDSQVLGICSGAFLSQPVVMEELEKESQMKLSTLNNPTDALLEKVNKSSDIETLQGAKEVTDSQILAVCSGSFASQPVDALLGRENKSSDTELQQRAKEVTDSQILAVCSGSFASQPMNFEEPEEKLSPARLPTIGSRLDSWLGVPSAKQDDQDIEDTILLNSDASESFQLASNGSARNLAKEMTLTKTLEALISKEESGGLKESKETRPVMKIVSSSDEEESKSEALKSKKKLKKKKKKKVQKLNLSDDEDEDLNEYSDEEGSELEDDDEENYIDYDSDENEIVVSKKDIKKVAHKFFEKEAELSESEWGSADEDERDLDKFEAEEGDADEIDENKVKNQLDRIHMKQVMDEDQREVRMLQELLFDDGDLHSDGGGRERKFRWKNIDNMDVELGPRTEDDETLFDDDIDTAAEVQMRRLRYEQQKFLEEKEKKAKGLPDDITDSEAFKLGLKIVNARTTLKSAAVEKSMDKSNPDSSNSIKPIGVTNLVRKTVMASKNMSFSNIRGSFLARGEATLVRISQHLPESNKTKVNASKAQKFVFAHLSPSVPKEDSQKNSDGTENDSTPKDKKRKRKIFSSQTPTSTKKLKVNDGLTGKKLF